MIPAPWHPDPVPLRSSGPTEQAGAGRSTIRLDTNGALTAALALYRSTGYVEVAPFNDEPHADHWFEKALGERGTGT